MNVTIRELSGLALGLPTRSRAILADLLLDSLDDGSPESYDTAWLELAKRRDAELDKETAGVKNHSDVMAAAREAVRCAS